jgi:hypothetical protein
MATVGIRRGTLERCSATTPCKHSAMSRVEASREEEQVWFCHLRLDYRAGPLAHQTADPPGARLRRLLDSPNAGRL